MDEYESADDLCSPDDNGDNSEAEDGNGEIFAETLKRAQQIAVTHEREREKGRKRPHRYTKNSKRTRERQAKIGKDMQKTGFLSVANFFAHIRQKIANKDGASETSARSQAPSSGAEIIEEVPGGSGEDLEMDSGESGGSDAESEKDEEEDRENDEYLHGTPTSENIPTDPSADPARQKVAEMLADLRAGRTPKDDSLAMASDLALD
ncbi:hypothetical protein DFH08DRAFT_1088679 [Mycena albidolilacea]|uniref:Uncharacterized protein n=1 Tax=Mycena albidolilacea TaxID=1033008 RepID=A0AAD7EB60_9AGAR|nr:hypothetical protein DFH08DRAFT_1088679 [Mycena albidolilacea]